MNILVVEDQAKTVEFIKSSLALEGYKVDSTDSGKQAEIMVLNNRYDLLLLDIMLPDQSGIDTALHIRESGADLPILMLTALSTTKDKVAGLDAGADDYLTKPFSLEELSARIRALTRRKTQPTEKTTSLSFSDITMHLIERKVYRNNIELTLTTKEFSLLEYFLKNPNKPLSRKEISEDVWNIHFDTETNFIDVYINLLRKKLDSAGNTKKLIHTVVGVGYILKEA